MICFAAKHSKFEVGGCCRLDVFSLMQQNIINILCKNFCTLRIISGSKCAVSEREICLKFKKNEILAERANQKRKNNLPLARQFALHVTAVKLQGPVIYLNQG